ncbi:MAG: hypothetical protein GY838_13355 [bacterium]|nr:hypothetical protein [bacterium]
MARILPADLDVQSRDFDSLRERLTRTIASVHPDWSDTAVANFGNILLESGAFVGDVVDKYRSAQFAEAFFSVCTRRINGVKHARPLGYTFSGQTASTVDIQFSLTGTYDDIPLTAGMIIRSASATNPARFQILADATIPAGNSAFSVATENSQSHTKSFTSTDLADQRLLLDQTPFLEVVSVGDDITPVGAPDPWAKVDNFLSSTNTDPHYMVLLSDNDRALVVFGDGTNGRIPSGVTTVNSKSGGGAISVDPGTLIVPEFSLTDALGAPVTFAVTNPLVASPGTARETLANAQRELPGQMTVNSRSVAQPDYGINAQRVSGVSKALILTSDQLAGIPENNGFLYLVARGAALASGGYAPTTATTAQKDEVRALIEGTYKPTITFEYSVVDPVLTTINITAKVRLAQGAAPATVDAAIRSNLADFFAVELVDPDDSSLVVANADFKFGWEMKDELGGVRNIIAWSKLVNIVDNTTGVDEVDKTTFVPIGNTTIPYNSIPVLGTVTLLNDRTGLALV